MPRQETGEPYYRVILDEVMELYEADDTVVVDVRRPDEYEAGHVKGAMHIPVDDVLARIEELPTDKRLLFICAAGVRSGLACEMASAMGLDTENLFNIEDGTGPWIDRGFPTSLGTDA
jgi:rhodanese-related sulfurtransferase